MIGPSLGGGIYSLFGFKAPWILYASAIVIANAVFFLIYMKKEETEAIESAEQLRESLVAETQEEPQIQREPSEVGETLNFLQIIKVKRSLFGLLVQFMGYFTGGFFIPLVTNVYELQRGLSPSYMGLLMGCMAFAYVSAIPVYTKYVLPKTNYRICIYIGYITLLTGCWLSTFDPDGTKNGQLVFGFIGMILGGIGNSFTLLPVMPEITSGVEEYYAKEGIKFNRDQLHNNLAGYFQVFMSIGEMVGPGVSSQVYDNFDQRWTKSFLCMFGGIYILTHIFVCGWK